MKPNQNPPQVEPNMPNPEDLLRKFVEWSTQLDREIDDMMREIIRENDDLLRECAESTQLDREIDDRMREIIRENDDLLRKCEGIGSFGFEGC